MGICDSISEFQSQKMKNVWARKPKTYKELGTYMREEHAKLKTTCPNI